MIFSEKKLRKIANLNNDITTDNILVAINSIGFEVESIENIKRVSNIKFGHVLEVEKNPNSLKLNVCKIQFSDNTRIIQTAAQNVKKDDYVIAFIPGSKINDIEIKEKEMGKIISEGMLASMSELGFDKKLLNDEQKENVITFKNEIDLNLDPIEYFELDDNLIDVSILSNRSDALSYEIFAKELSAYFKTKPITIKNHKSKTFNSNIELISKENVNLYGVEIKNENFSLSINDYLTLLKSKIKIENNDIINFSNLNLIVSGVSIRAIDLDKINSEKIEIIEKNNITSLYANNQIISTLGIEVNKNFEATNESKNILFEFSQIDEKIVRNNSKLTKIINQSSINNSRNISYGSILIAFNFIKSYFSNSSNLINYKEPTKLKIKFDYNYIKNYAGIDIKNESSYKNALNSLEILDFTFEKSKNISIPLYRHDIKNMQGIVEEIFRFYGFNNFDPIEPKLKNFVYNDFNNLEQTISSLGYKQVWTYTLINKEKNIFNPFGFKNKFNLKTYVSEEYNSIRNSIAIPIMDIYEYNLKRKIDNLSIFDIGMINNKKSILISSNQKSFKEIKFDIFKIANQKFQVRKLFIDFLHPNYNAGLYLSGKLVGWIGKFNPHFIDSDIIFAEILEESIYYPKNQFIEYNNEPLKERDITFTISKDFEHAQYLEKLNSIEGVYSISFISSFKKSDNETNLTYKIKMNNNALSEFEKIDWNNKEKLFDF